MSIHKINLNHHKIPRKPIGKIIEFIVDKYNKGRKNEFESKEVQRGYEPAVKPEDEKYFVGEPFRVKVYIQKVGKKISLLNSYGITEKAITIHTLIFHYRTDELFAITTNQSWNVVQWCSDFEFPGKIAARILSRDGELESTNKGLVGTELTRKTIHKQQNKTNPYDLLTFCTRFTAELRGNASILRLSCFQKKNSVPVPENEEEIENEDENEAEVQPRPSSKIKSVKMAVSLGNIRFLKRFSTSDMLSVLSFMSLISNDKVTVNLDGETEQNSSAHKKYLTAIDTEVANELNVCLSAMIHDAIAEDNRMSELDNFQFCHKHSTDFFAGYNFKLFYRGNLRKQFKEVPTIKQIVVELRHDLGNIDDKTTDEAFCKLLNHAKISYLYGSNKMEKKPDKFINFIDGLMNHPRDNGVFWHVSARWCHVQDGYLYLVHNQFKKMLTSYLLTDKNDPGYLPVHWPKHRPMERLTPDDKLEIYLKKYTNSEDTWTSDLPGVDIVDMIRVGTDSAGKKIFYVYYFLPAPNYKTNIKCNHVAESIMQIGKANRHMTKFTQGTRDDVAGSEDVRKQLKDIYRRVSENRQLKNICRDFENFLRMITGAKFYLAIGRDNSTVDAPSLVEENQMTTTIAVDDITGILENLIDNNDDASLQMIKETAKDLKQPFDKSRCSQLAESIHHKLRECEYIEAQGNSIRGKLFSQSKKNFAFTSKGNVNQFLFEKIISKFQPRACTVLSKLAFIDMREKISKLTITSFNLMEIPMMK